jgi:hypothetical protein
LIVLASRVPKPLPIVVVAEVALIGLAFPGITGVTVTVATTGAVPVLIAVKAPISPVPLAPRPIDASLFVQLYVTVVPVFGVVKVTGVVNAPLHTT